MPYDHLHRPRPPNKDLHVSLHGVFGCDARIHPVTQMVLEQGSGSLPDDQQVLYVHLPHIEQTQGKAVADGMRKKLGILTREEIAAQETARQAAYQERLKRALALLEKVENEHAA